VKKLAHANATEHDEEAKCRVAGRKPEVIQLLYPLLLSLLRKEAGYAVFQTFLILEVNKFYEDIENTFHYFNLFSLITYLHILHIYTLELLL
jgi:hypothetical protein